MTLKLKFNYLHFQYQPQVSQDACLLQIWWLQPKSLMSYCTNKVKLTDEQTARWTDAGNDDTPSAWLAKE